MTLPKSMFDFVGQILSGLRQDQGNMGYQLQRGDRIASKGRAVCK